MKKTLLNSKYDVAAGKRSEAPDQKISADSSTQCEDPELHVIHTSSGTAPPRLGLQLPWTMWSSETLAVVGNQHCVVLRLPLPVDTDLHESQ